VRAGDLRSAHDVAEGGLLVALAESCLAGGIGATIDPWPAHDPLHRLFGECPGGGFVVSGAREAIDRLAERVPLTVFGTVGGDSLSAANPATFEVSLAELRSASSSLSAVFS
jgi:phosphoribosylformylglycinamidine synthase subunit PurL